MYNPLVSIIIPVYNGSNFLKESINSALTQTYENIEIIVINDGSTDGGLTESIALSYGDKIRYFYKENGGVSSALNLGITKMEGEWFSWLSHDDLYLPTKVESQINCVINKNLDKNKTIISCKTGLINAEGKPIFRPKKYYTGFYDGKKMFKHLCKERSFGGCSLLIPKIALESVGGFDEEYRFIQDRICWLELAMANNNFYLDGEELVKSRVHGNQETVRLANLQPVEVNNFLNDLLTKLSIDVNKNSYYIKTILFYYSTKKKSKEVRKSYINSLKKHNKFDCIDLIKYLLLLLGGKINILIKKLYRKILKTRHRRNN